MREKLPIIDIKSHGDADREFKKTVQFQKETRQLLAFGILICVLATLYFWSQQSHVLTMILLAVTGGLILKFLKVDQAYRTRMSELPKPDKHIIIDD